MTASTPMIDLPSSSLDVDQVQVSIFHKRLVRHPTFVLRIGGESLSLLRSFDANRTAFAVDTLSHRRINKDEAVHRACVAIEAVVPTLLDATVKRSLISIKRDLFNGRAPRVGLLDTVRPVLDVETKTALDEVGICTDRYADAENLLLDAYDADVAQGSAALRRASERHNLRSALISASPSLIHSLNKLESGQSLRRKDWTNLHLALAGFVTRAAAKTSPRSSFTLVALGTWDSNGEKIPCFEIDQPILSRKVRIRHSILERLLLPLTRDVERLLSEAPICVNHTAKIVGEVIQWQRIAYSESPEMETLGIISTTNRINLPPALVKTLIDFGIGTQLRLSDCRKALSREADVKSQEASDRLLQKLLGLEILVLDDQRPSQGDKLVWASRLARWMQPEIAEAITAGVDNLSQSINAIAATGPQIESRCTIERELDLLAEKVGATTRVADVKPSFYEDCTIAAPSIRMREEALSEIWDDLDSLLSLLPLLRGYGWAGAWLTSRFVGQFGVGGRCDDPQTFLSGTAEALAVAGGGSDGAPPWQTGTVPDDPEAHEQDAVSARFAAALREHNSGEAEWDVPTSLVAKFYAMLPLSYRRRSRSHCVNGQLVSTGGGFRFILNSVYPGNGRMTSRFLEAGDAASSYVRSISPGEPVAIPGVFGFNANVHPQLCMRELVIPPFPVDYTTTDKIVLAECSLRHDPKINRVVLDGPDGQLLTPYYFGILNSWALPPIHRALDWMSGASDLPFSVPDAIVSRDRPADPPVTWGRPRINLGSITLGRRSWSIAKKALPDPTLEDVAFFVALRTAWSDLQLPRTAFFHASNFWSARDPGSSRPNKARKPMYLDIDNVWLVKAFAKTLRSMSGYIVIAECLPEPDDTPVRVNGKTHAAEITVELGLSQADD